jgi:hypothetical protein
MGNQLGGGTMNNDITAIREKGYPIFQDPSLVEWHPYEVGEYWQIQEMHAKQAAFEIFVTRFR